MMISSHSWSQQVSFWQIDNPSHSGQGGKLQAYLGSVSHLQIISSDDLSKKGSLKRVDILWMNSDDTASFTASDTREKVIRNLLRYVETGGRLVLSNQAAMLLPSLGIEPVAPVTRLKQCRDEGYGRMLGFHSFRGHPLFDGLNGGAYILKPDRDTVVFQTGYFGEALPKMGKVIGVDWDYIFLREDSKMIIEFSHGDGKILMIGGYMNFDIPNRNWQHLEQFTVNIISYLTNKTTTREHYWHYGPGYVQEEAPALAPIISGPAVCWDLPWSGLALQSVAEGNFWEAAGERMLAMGTDNGGIEEVWAHPFMSLRDVEVAFKTSAMSLPANLSSLKPETTTYPWGYVRLYIEGDLRLKEVITVSPDKPALSIHYESFGRDNVQLFFRFRSIFRNMWPYSEKVLGGIRYSWNKEANAFVMRDLSGDFVSILGMNRSPHSSMIGPLDLKDFSEDSAIFLPPDTMHVQGMMSITLTNGEAVDVIGCASNEGLEKTLSYYSDAMRDPGRVCRDAWEASLSSEKDKLTFQTSSDVFNTGFEWAMIAAGRFFVTTPGIGSSLVAGYATSDKGWDGGHKVSGRPGYGWYFGRDGEWSGMALLQTGDFEKVRSMLETFIRFQDLNGKIFHELSTSGFVHYDAADATPLFIVLAGRYLRQSGDQEFIHKNWPSIRKAIDYCYSTDTDNDGLIENTNVGHGWEEGGGLYGCHTTLYLASCWAEALKEASIMARTAGHPDQAAVFAQDAEKINDEIDNQFWNAGKGYYYHGLYKDGAMLEEPSIMPAIPMLFGQSDTWKAQQTLPVFASDSFSSDWGCRIVSENSPMFNPNGYHTGSVWPLFSGWASLAEFKYHNYLQGFTHLMNNLLIYKHWGQGYVEEVLNGATFQPSGVCHHQCWSETMVLQPGIEGMLGFLPDAPDHLLQLKPWFPADWDSVSITNLKVGSHQISLKMKRLPGRTVFFFSQLPDTVLDIRFNPVLPPGTVIESVRINGQPAREPEFIKVYGGWMMARFGFRLTGETEVTILHNGGITMLPIVPEPEPGDTSRGFRIISTEYDDGTYTVLLQGKRMARERFRIWTDQGRLPLAEGAALIGQEGNMLTYEVEFQDTEGEYASRVVSFEF